MLPGDGIGPEVTRAAVRSVERLRLRFFTHIRISRVAVRRQRHRSLAAIRCPRKLWPDAVPRTPICWAQSAGPNGNLFRWARVRKPACLLCARSWAFTSICGQRDLRPSLTKISPLRPERWRIAISRSFANSLETFISGSTRSSAGKNGDASARDVADYSVPEIERVARYAFERAASRKRNLTSVDKANVLATSTLWRQTVAALAREYPGVTLDHLYVDNAADANRAAPGAIRCDGHLESFRRYFERRGGRDWQDLLV